MRVVVDTNILVSSLIVPRGISAQLMEHWRRRSFYLLTSEPVLEECTRVLQYPRIRRKYPLTDQEILRFITFLREQCEVVWPEMALDAVAQDPDDNRILECAVAGGADYIVTGDDHLLRLGQYQDIQVVPPAAFLLLLGFSPLFFPVAVAFLMRATLMNMAMPLYSAFAMEQVSERQQGIVNSVKELGWQGGYVVGTAVSGLVQQSYGFSPLFAATALLYALATGLTWAFFHKHSEPVVAIVPGLVPGG